MRRFSRGISSMARLRSPVAASRSWYGECRWIPLRCCFGRRLTWLGDRSRRQGMMSAETQKACVRGLPPWWAMEFGPRGRGRFGAPSAVGVSFSAHRLSRLPSTTFPSTPVFLVPAPIRRRSSVPAILRLLPALPEIPARSGCFSPRQIRQGHGGAASSA